MSTMNSYAMPVSRVEAVGCKEAGKCLAEYIWLGGTGSDLKSRTVVLDARPGSLDELPIAEIDGSSYGLACEAACEVYLQPRSIFPDPLRGGDHILVLCDTYCPPAVLPPGGMAAAPDDAWDSMRPHAANHRAACEAVMAQAAHQQPLFSAQQEYCLFAAAAPPAALDGGFKAAPGGGGLLPLADGGFAFSGGLPQQHQHQPGSLGSSSGCRGGDATPSPAVPISVGGGGLHSHHHHHRSPALSSKASARLGRDVAEVHMRACMAAGLAFGGSHMASAPHQWAFKLGPLDGTRLGDQLCISRFLLGRAAEQLGAELVYDSGSAPPGTHPGHALAAAGNKCVLSFSTATSRDPATGLFGVTVMMERMRASHEQFMQARGSLCASPGGSSDGRHATAASPHTQHASSGGGSWHSALDAFGVTSPALPAAAGASSSPLLGPQQSGGSFTIGVGNKHAAIMVPTSTLVNGSGPILDRRPPASADPYLAALLLASAACGVQAPQPQCSAQQLAAAMAAAVRGCTPATPTGSSSPPLAIRGGAAASRCCRPAFSSSSSSLLGGSSCSGGSSLLGDSEDSRDVLLSALDRLEGFRASGGHGCATSRGLKRPFFGVFEEEEDCGLLGGHHAAEADACSDASSPPRMPAHALAAAGGAMVL